VIRTDFGIQRIAAVAPWQCSTLSRRRSEPEVHHRVKLYDIYKYMSEKAHEQLGPSVVNGVHDRLTQTILRAETAA